MVTDPLSIRELIRFRFGDYLLETGWIKSVRRKEPVIEYGVNAINLESRRIQLLFL
jgi:hypothetical protein